jgi:hypothetical protein
MTVLLLFQQAATIASSTPAPTGVSGAVDQFTDFLLRYLAPLAAVGAFSMAFIELGKKLLDSRTKFQTLRWVLWMNRSEFGAKDRLLVATGKSGEINLNAPSTEQALAELLQLCTGVSPEESQRCARDLVESGGHLPLWNAWSPSAAHAVFALDLERMMGSIQDAADVALASPQQFESLYRFMTTGADTTDVNRWHDDGPSAMLDVGNLPEAEQRRAVKEHAERFARLRQVVKRKLDGFQLYTGDRWASWNQFAANIVGFIVLFFALLWAQWSNRHVALTTGNLFGSFTYTIIPISLLGGILSPVAKDLVSALKRVKDG